MVLTRWRPAGRRRDANSQTDRCVCGTYDRRVRRQRTTYWDESLPGFGVLVTEKGHKSYVVQYRTAPGRTGIDRRMTLKTTLKLDDARREAKAILGQVATRCGPAGGTV